MKWWNFFFQTTGESCWVEWAAWSLQLFCCFGCRPHCSLHRLLDLVRFIFIFIMFKIHVEDVNCETSEKKRSWNWLVDANGNVFTFISGFFCLSNLQFWIWRRLVNRKHSKVAHLFNFYKKLCSFLAPRIKGFQMIWINLYNSGVATFVESRKRVTTI